MTYRERRERRAARLREWAEKREAKAAAARDEAHRIGDRIPLGQPILVGHHSQRRAERDRDRLQALASKGLKHSRKADSMAGRAANIEAQLDRAIYSDDDDAAEKLRERIAGLEAERDRIKAYNASCRKGAADVSLLDEEQRAKLLSTAKVAAYQIGKNGAAPVYWLANLNGNIARNRKRLERLER